MMYKVSVHAKRGFLLKLLLLQIGCLCAIGITAKTHADSGTRFTASVPENLEVNDQFRLMFTVFSTRSWLMLSSQDFPPPYRKDLLY